MARNTKSNHGPSFLRWAGSKRKCLSLLSAGFTDLDRDYIEPFAGSASLFFSLRPRSALLGDLNGHLVNTLRQVRKDPEALHAGLSAIPRNSRAYYRVRDNFNSLRPHGMLSAVHFTYLNRNCFNGLWRTNSAGEFNVPYGGLEMGRHPPLSLLQRCSSALKAASIKNQDFRKTIADASRGSFVYADPPYFTSTERTFVEYGKQSFGQDDLNDLIDALRAAASRGAQVVLTYNAAMQIRHIPKSWYRMKFQVTRNVGGFAGARKVQAEILYSNVRLER